MPEAIRPVTSAGGSDPSTRSPAASDPARGDGEVRRPRLPPSALPPLIPLAVIVGISPLATDMYIPALPAIAADLSTSTGTAQLSLTAFLVAFAVGQFLIGPISDAVGRRRLLLAGTLTFALASVACALAGGPLTLIFARIAQGLAGACGSVVGRAVVTDVLQGRERARTIGSLAAVNAVGPVVAPLIGGALLLVGSWRLMFLALALLGVALAVTVATRFTETLPPGARATGVGLGASAARMAVLLRRPRFTAYLITSSLATIGFFAYISTSSFVFQRQFGFSETAYTLLFASNASAMIASTLVFRRVVDHDNEDLLLSLGLVGGALGSLGVLAAALFSLGPDPVWACLAVVTGSWGFVITGSATRTQALGHDLPGTAAALQGGLSFGLGGLGTPLAGLLGGTATAMGAILAIGLVLAAGLQLLATHRFAGPPVAAPTGS